MALEIDSPNNFPIVVRTVQTGPSPPPGEISILQVLPCDDTGNPKTSFKRNVTNYLDFFYVKVTVKNNNPTEAKNVVIVANSYDGNGFSLGVDSVKMSPVSPGATQFPILSIPIPEWASVGNAMVYANVFTDWPGRGTYGVRPLNGIPYCPEENATFEITDGTLAAVTSEAQGSGNYNLTFGLAPDAKAGIYRVYAASSYEGYYITNNTLFGVNAIYVPNHFASIQEAVNAATSTNKSILVFSGTYNEHVTIDKSLTLVGANPSTTIIVGSETGTVVTVTSDNVEISKFTIKNGSGSFPNGGITLNNSGDSIISENTILDNCHGVYLNNFSQRNIIIDNVITLNNGNGIEINSSDNNEISGNTLLSNNYGIHLNHSTGMTLKNNDMICNKYNFAVFGDSLSDFSHTIYESNRVDGKPIIYWTDKSDKEVPSNAGFVAIVNSAKIAVRGLSLKKNGQGVLFAFTTDSFIERVNAARNYYGIYLVNSYGNTIMGSEISNNTVGIYQSYTNQNIICHNSLVNNTNQVDLNQSSNTWDDSDGKGNHWSDYTGEDLDSDGIGDTLLPHQGVDWYPLMGPPILVHDVAVTNLAPIIPYNASQVYPGWKINVTITVKNKGDFTETLVVRAYYNANIFDEQPFTLFPLANSTLTLTWELTLGTSPGTYEIKAEASLTGDNNMTDNTSVDGTIEVKQLGDVDGNGDLNILDVATVATVFSLGIYNPLCDMDMNGYVNILDVATTASAMVLYG